MTKQIKEKQKNNSVEKENEYGGRDAPAWIWNNL